ncbi:MAG: hypothetical protein M4D80_28585 [Myxococcota bacterium]|nr:hypothetical protein [Deltaproteobacteria bacterium]MDQ3339137.1 hypothetical protein [Myxococcota bacterium]
MRALACVFLIACGGGDSEVVGDPLIQTTLTAEFANRPWTPMFGFGRTETTNMQTRFTLFLGQQKISCADDFDGQPREGNYAAVGIPSAVVGNNTALLMNMIEVTDGNLTMKLAMGGLQITAVSATEVSAVFSFDTNDAGMRYAVNGAVTMLVCP